MLTAVKVEVWPGTRKIGNIKEDELGRFLLNSILKQITEQLALLQKCSAPIALGTWWEGGSKYKRSKYQCSKYQ